MDPCVTFVTGNANKLREVKAILEPAIRVQSTAFDLEEIQGTIHEVTEYKCRKAADLVNGPVLVEDTALCFHALGDLPGPYIKWFLSAIGHDGLNNLLAAYTDKSADAVCTFGYSAGPGQKPILLQGRCAGKIVPPRGPSHFGWDPVFEFQGQTFAEMDGPQKNTISHRARALKQLQDWFKDQPGAYPVPLQRSS
ncbi:ham1 family protein [Hirsutella rhossiliensis]|uniref:Inosine triphosphate pyrophosphatase n=1 Tax=Hirsutella rhossiliensis TaxID=111463 RepID=A0A9P8SKL0_9HYPO|nr:ham1 family domain-containing protein [Hirsutella rhossiliensis]KAH0964880.1 ham1 family domain-containing protein [Hirsutella rhossiliensis]